MKMQKKNNLINRSEIVNKITDYECGFCDFQSFSHFYISSIEVPFNIVSTFTLNCVKKEF